MKKNITKLFILVCGISLLVLTIVNADKNKNSKEFEEYVLVKNGDLGRIDSVSRNFSELLDFFVLDQSHSLLNIDESLWSEELSAYTPERINEIYKNCNLPTRKFLYVVDNFVGYPFETVENHSITLIPTEYRDYIWRLVLYSFHKYGDVYTEYSYDEYDNVHMSYSPLSEEEIYDRWVETVEKTATEYLQDWFDAGYGYMTRDELNNWNIKNPLPTRADLEGNHSLPWGTYQYNAFLYEPLKRIDMELYDDYRIVQELLLLHPYLDPSVKALPLTKEEECTVLYYYDTSGGKISSSIQRKTGSYIYYFSISENKYINSGILSGHIGNTLIENEEFFNIVKNLQSEGYHAVTYDDTRYDFAYDS